MPPFISIAAPVLMGLACALFTGACLIDRGPLPLPMDRKSEAGPREDSGLDSPSGDTIYESDALGDVVDVVVMHDQWAADAAVVDVLSWDVPPVPRVVGIDLGFESSCAWLSDGSGKCWGFNNHGQLGDGTTMNRSNPVSVVGLSGVKAISAGGGHTCAVVAPDDEVRCWGKNGRGQLGDETTMDRRTPVVVRGLSGVKAISAGGEHTCTLLGSGEMRCWGSNQHGQLGNGMGGGNSPMVVTVYHAGSSFPLNNVSAITTGEAHTCALLDFGEVRCWGRNNHGQLGNGTVTDSPSPVQTLSGTPSGGSLASVQSISAGWNHTCALLSSGGVRCWGRNNHGQLGDGTRTGRSTPVSVMGLSDVAAISAGGEHTCALLGSGDVRCWGRNNHGQLGDGMTMDSSTPVSVMGLSGVVAISAGGEHTCALLSSGDVRCWGRNNHGQLGDGTTEMRTTPVMVRGL